MKTFPIMLDVRGRRAVVVGGGAVGLRKVRALLRAGADVTVVDPRAGPSPRGVAVVRRRYRPGMLAGAALVFACTADRALNARIAADARAADALVNAADQTEDCDFYLPAVAAEGDVIVAVGTGGSAPALASMLKRTLAAALPPHAGQFAAALAGLRAGLRSIVSDPRRRMRIVQRLVEPEAYKAFLAGGKAALRAHMDRLVNESHKPSPRRRRLPN